MIGKELGGRVRRGPGRGRIWTIKESEVIRDDLIIRRDTASCHGLTMNNKINNENCPSGDIVAVSIVQNDNVNSNALIILCTFMVKRASV